MRRRGFMEALSALFAAGKVTAEEKAVLEEVRLPASRSRSAAWGPSSWGTPLDDDFWDKGTPYCQNTYSVEERAQEKQRSREADARALASGEKSREQLNRENSFVSPDGGKIDWKKAKPGCLW